MFVLGSITSCGGMYHASLDGDMKNKKSGTNAGIHNIVSDGNIIMAITDNEILISKDNGNTWVKKTTPIKHFTSRVAYNNVWILTGLNKIVKSTDGGNTWTQKWEAAQKAIITVAGNGNTWVAVGYSGLMLISNDNGDTWIDKTNQNFTGNVFHFPNLYTVAFGNNTWIVTGYGSSQGEQVTLISRDNGNTWIKKTLFPDLVVTDMTYENGIWVATARGSASNKSEILISKDNGNTWIQKVLPITKQLNGIAFGNNLWVAVGYNGLMLISNDNGDTWGKKQFLQRLH